MGSSCCRSQNPHHANAVERLDVIERLDHLERLLTDELPDQDATSPQSRRKRRVTTFADASQVRYFAGQPSSSQYDVFISHAKKMPASEDRAVWLADVCELDGLKAFYDRSDLKVITEASLHEKLHASSTCITVIDPWTFSSGWVLQENLWATNAGIPIIPVYDSDRFKWKGQLDKWEKMYPYFFKREAIPLSKCSRHSSIRNVREALDMAFKEGIQPPMEAIRLEVNIGGAQTKIAVGGSQGTDTKQAVQTAYHSMCTQLNGVKPSLIICGFTCTHDANVVSDNLHELAPDVPMIGCTSCRGVVLNDSWLTHKKEYAMALWSISDYAGSYIVVHVTHRPPNLALAVESKIAEACTASPEPASFSVLLVTGR